MSAIVVTLVVNRSFINFFLISTESKTEVKFYSPFNQGE